MLNYNMKLDDIVTAFAELGEEMGKVPDMLDELPNGSNMYAALRNAAQHFIDEFTELRDKIEDIR